MNTKMKTMSLPLRAAALACLLLTPLTTRADGLLYQLPKDGAWVLFDLEMSAKDRMTKGTLKMSSVGAVKVDNKPCRWIELKMTVKMDEREETYVAKLLAPEKDLREGGKPFENRIRGWLKERLDGEVAELDEKNQGPVPIFLSSPLKDAKKLEPKIVESKLGKLKCAGVTGHIEYKEGEGKIKVTFETRRHKNAPFGVVTSNIKLEVERNGNREEFKMTFKLREVGKGAVSDLPDSK